MCTPRFILRGLDACIPRPQGVATVWTDEMRKEAQAKVDAGKLLPLADSERAEALRMLTRFIE